MSPYVPHAIATAITGLLYLAAARFAADAEGSARFNPLVITAGVHGRGSLSKLQIFYFSLIVVWMLVFFVIEKDEITDLSQTVLILLGVSAAGTVGSKITSVARLRLSLDNWAWLRSRGWIRESIEKKKRPPQIADLMSSDGEFDVAKFQMLAVSFVVGIAMIYLGIKAGSLAEFKVPDNVLGLLGLSQAVYIGGKATGPATHMELNKKLTDLRGLEGKFRSAVSQAWKAKAPEEVSLDAASKEAPEEYNHFKSAVREAAEMVQERIGASGPPANLEPDAPQFGV
jgi:hypothetical protein